MGSYFHSSTVSGPRPGREKIIWKRCSPLLAHSCNAGSDFESSTRIRRSGIRKALQDTQVGPPAKIRAVALGVLPSRPRIFGGRPCFSRGASRKEAPRHDGLWPLRCCLPPRCRIFRSLFALRYGFSKRHGPHSLRNTFALYQGTALAGPYVPQR